MANRSGSTRPTCAGASATWPRTPTSASSSSRLAGVCDRRRRRCHFGPPRRAWGGRPSLQRPCGWMAGRRAVARRGRWFNRRANRANVRSEGEEGVMVFGLSLSAYTMVHVIISLAAIGAGLVVVAGMVKGERLDGWTALFLWTSVLTSVTGFGFPFDHFLPSHDVGL